MTPRQRAVEALYRRSTDRVPCVPFIDNSYAAPRAGVPVSQCFLDPNIYAQGLVASLERHPDIDGVSINLCLTDEIIQDIRETRDEYLVKTTGGLTWMVPFNDVGSVLETEITSFDDPRLDEDDPFKPGIILTLRAIPEDLRKRYLFSCGLTGPFSQVGFMLGLTHIMEATVDDPEGLHRAIRKRVPFALRWVEEMAQYDPGCIWIGEGFASSSLIGAHTYKEFVLPYEQIVADKIREVGVPSVLHICGKIYPILDLIPDSRADCLEADWPVALEDARQRIADRISIKGNLNTTDLVRGEEAEIYDLSRKAIEVMKGKPGFILSSGCALGRDTPPEHVDAMARAARDFGQYA
jgi:uroporphyrinogen decarboxylase